MDIERGMCLYWQDKAVTHLSALQARCARKWNNAGVVPPTDTAQPENVTLVKWGQILVSLSFTKP